VASNHPRSAFLLAHLVLLITVSVDAQVITGNIVGSLKDESGAVVPGATVAITSPALIGGPSVFTTNAKGQYRFLNLAPGLYTLEVSLSGFASYREEALGVAVGGTVERNVVLKLAAVSESVVVSGESPLVDTRKSGVSTNYGSEFLENVPTRRFSVFDILKSAPGVAATNPTGTSDSVSVYGSGTNENAFLLDGTNFTSPRFGGAWPWPDTDIMEEVEVVSIGASAEYGNIQGGVFNVVTKQGGNAFRFDASYYFQTQDLTSQPVLLDCGCPEGETGYTRDRFRDFSAHAGGPILRDRLWFFGGYQRQRDGDSQPGADPRFPRQYEADRIFWKITWQITPRLKLLHSYHEDFFKDPQPASASSPFETTVTHEGHSPASTFAQVTHVLSADTFWEARLSRFRGPVDTVPNNGSLTRSLHFEVTTGVASGGALLFGRSDQSRTSMQGKLSHYATDFLASDHDFKFGVQFVRGTDTGFYGYPGGAVYIDYGGQPLFAYLREPYSYGSEFNNLGVFAEDVVRVGERLTLNLGLRFDHSRAISQDIDQLDAVGEPTGGTVDGLGTLYTWDVFSPRLGFNWKIAADGKTVVRANYSRFYQGVITSELGGFHPGVTPFATAFFNPSTGEYSDVVSVVDPRANLQIDPNTDPPQTDQFSIGLERELRSDLALSVNYVRKEGRDFTGWKDVGGVYGTDTAALPDGKTLTVFPLLNSPSERIFRLTNPENYFLQYDGVSLAVTKRWSHSWQGLVSYTWSEAEGLQTASGRGAGSAQNSSTPTFLSFGQDPNDLTNATGNLPNDRTHMFRAQGWGEIPKIAVLVGVNYQYFTGKPWTGHAPVILPQGGKLINVEPRGSQRLSSQSLLDLRLSKIFRFNQKTRLELILDVLNLLNDDAEQSVATENVFSPNFAEGVLFVPPRRAMIGVKFYF
jgi:outer membrane receptor protein involved in Fe transport